MRENGNARHGIKVLEALTPFFPGIAHSHVIRFRDPSGFFIGLATNP